jgi:WD40 repeat protein
VWIWGAALCAAAEPVLVYQSGHFGRSMTFTPDGRRLVVAGAEGAAVWDVEAGAFLYRFDPDPGQQMPWVDLSPDGRQVVTSAGDRAATWDTRTGARLYGLQGYTSDLLSASFSADGRRLATALGDRSAAIWSAGALVHRLDGHAGAVFSTAFSPDGLQVVTASADRTAAVWDAERGDRLRHLTGHSDVVFTAAFSPDGQRVVTASFDDTAAACASGACAVDLAPLGWMPGGDFELVVGNGDDTATSRRP